jgi:hypothetical protein
VNPDTTIVFPTEKLRPVPVSVTVVLTLLPLTVNDLQLPDEAPTFPAARPEKYRFARLEVLELLSTIMPLVPPVALGVVCVVKEPILPPLVTVELLIHPSVALEPTPRKIFDVLLLVK